MKQVIGIDIGGTKTVGAIINEKKQILKELRIPTNPQHGPDNLIRSIEDIINELCNEYSVDAIGIGSAGRINIDQGTVHFASDNIPGWTGVRIKEVIENKFKIPTFVENDCKVTGLGEEWNGAAKGVHSYVCVALGTGVGAAVKIDGNMLHGKDYSAGELGHMILYPNGRQCNCGLCGCVEQYLSGPSLVKSYNALSKCHVKTGYEFFELIQSNNKIAKLVLTQFVDDLVVFCQSIYNIYDPQMIIIGGGLVDTKQYWWDEFQNKIEHSPLSKILRINVVEAQLGSKAALYGAAYLALQNI